MRLPHGGIKAMTLPGLGTCPVIPRRELITLLAYLDEGSHKAAAHRLGIAESTCRQRIWQLIGRVGARKATQAVWRLRQQLEAEERHRR
jgi:DNA-binding NarL/FixJ family response regulator